MSVGLPANTEVLDELLGKLRDDVLTDSDVSCLDKLLRDDGAAQRYYAEAVMLIATFRRPIAASSIRPVHPASASSRERLAVAAPGDSERSSAPVAPTSFPIYRKGYEPKPTPFIIYPIAIAAALLVAGIAVAIVSVVAEQNRQREIEQQKAELAERIAKRPVATLIESTGKLNTPHGYPAEGSSYGRGEYTLDSGKAEFMLTNAVNVKLRDETRMFMRNDMNVTLTRGSAEFVVPKDAKGFTVHLPDRSKVVDLGTAFRVIVDDAGQTRLRVTEGLVEWQPETRDASNAEPVQIAAGRVARIVDGRIELLDAADNATALFKLDFGTHHGIDDEWDAITDLDAQTAVPLTDRSEGFTDDDVTLTIVDGDETMVNGTQVEHGFGDAVTIDSIAVPRSVGGDYAYRSPDAPTSGRRWKIENLNPGVYHVSVFEGRKSDSNGQYGKLWVGDESGSDEPDQENTGNFAGHAATHRVVIYDGDVLWYAHLEDGTGGISGMIIRGLGADAEETSPPTPESSEQDERTEPQPDRDDVSPISHEKDESVSSLNTTLWRLL